jgi:hypothetical protein
MNARDKVKAASLRRVADELFAAEARRRGFTTSNGRTWVNTDELERALNALDAVVMSMVCGGDIFSCLRAIKRATAELGEYLKITRLESERRARKAGAQ